MDSKFSALDRREFLQGFGNVAAASLAGIFGNPLLAGSKTARAVVYQDPLPAASQALLSSGNPLLAGRPSVRYPEKTDLILLTSRPPQLETPMKYFERAITPNEAFYVRYHIPPPSQIDLSSWRLKVDGLVERPLELSQEDLRRKFTPATIVAVNQCSGNSRGFFSPRVFGGQWANGAMGNAAWTGVRLRDVLSMAGLKPGALEITFNGLDKPPLPTVPDFVKSLGVARATEDPDVLIAYQMNGRPLPVLNGYPARLIVPGWYGTYWVKNLEQITVLDHEFDGFWMRKAYLIPDTPCGCVEPGTTPARTVPINRMRVRSFIASPQDGTALRAGRTVTLKGIAFDGGSGIRDVSLSADRGANWQPAQLGSDLGNYSFREWSFRWTPQQPGEYRLMARATNRAGDSQAAEPIWNPAGYLRSSIEYIDIRAE